MREGLIDEIVHGIDPGSILFDAPRKDQQVWFVRRFGSEVNLGNVPPDEVLASGDPAARPAVGHDGRGSAWRRLARAAAVLLARHGETNDNLPPLRFQGWRDTPLNDTGRRQAAELAERMAGEGIVSLWSSDLSRARETAEIVGRRHRAGAEARLAPARGQPRRLGGPAVRGRQARGARALRGLDASRARTGAFPGGESLPEQQERVLACIDDIRAEAGCRRSPSAMAARSGSSSAPSDPRGLAAFHTFEVPNTSVVSA